MVDLDDILDNICGNVFRIADGDKQTHFANDAKISRSVINKIWKQAQKGVRMPTGLSLQVIVRIANALNVHPADLLGKPSQDLSGKQGVSPAPES